MQNFTDNIVDINTKIKSYYVYRHIRLDKNEVFYVGIGTKFLPYGTITKEYQRAYSKRNRNRYWKSITSKCKYEVEILYESDDHKEILLKEIYFIKLYGRKDLNTGSLCNFTNGGEGSFGRANPNGGIPMKVDMYDLNGNFLKTFKTITEAIKTVNLKSKSNIISVCKGNKISAGGFRWSYTGNPLIDRFDHRKIVSLERLFQLRSMSGNRLKKKKI